MKLSLITLAAVVVFCVANVAFASTTSYDFNLSDSEKTLNITPSVTIDDNWTLDLTVSLTQSYNEYGTALLATGDTLTPITTREASDSICHKTAENFASKQPIQIPLPL